ncbi:hypothetical protein C8Q70DRAFT_378146 [Cubamyces menziesii]|nr:hypothetical protein C8Q70DRAFT_378146 [Cubamyces menziesii]
MPEVLSQRHTILSTAMIAERRWEKESKTLSVCLSHAASHEHLQQPCVILVALRQHGHTVLGPPYRDDLRCAR